VPFTLLAVFGNWNVGGSGIQAKEEDSDPEMQTVVADARGKD
jgi:hypothetical protein